MGGLLEPRRAALRAFGCAIIFLAANTASFADGSNWNFSVYSYDDMKFITLGPYLTRQACMDDRDGYLRNDRYRNASECV
jgi:hypothetical protein